MGKIKSALELAMERTADLEGIKSAAGEPAGSEYERYLKAALLLADSFLKKESTADKIFQAVDRYPAGAQKEAIHILLKKIVAGMTVENISETAAFCRRYSSGGKKSLIKEIEALGRSYREQMQRLHSEAESGEHREQPSACLQQEGISGSAVAGVNLERSPWWREQLERLTNSSAPELDRLKGKLLSSLRK